jgi:hypothetical protein
MAILRTGPWRSFDSVLDFSVNADPITDFSSEPTAAPVNVAFDNWTNQNWGAVAFVTRYDPSTGNSSYIGGELIGLGGSSSVSGTGYEDNLFIYYFWQSTQDVTLEVDWSSNGTDGFDWSYNYITIDGDSGSDNGYAPTGNTEFIVLPAATLGRMRVFGGLSASLDTLTITLDEF